VIDGNIGSGKSTQLKMFMAEGYSVKCEPIHEWPLKDFYEDKRRWSFLLQMSILASFLKEDDVKIWERSPESSRDVFWKMLRDEGIGTDEEELVYNFFYTRNSWKPDVHVYIRTDPVVCFERISKRVQEGDSKITLDYIKRVHEYYEAYISTKQNLIIIDGDRSPENIHEDIKNATAMFRYDETRNEM
jgi:deoxyadenosine/deoxycytidine kinase